MKTTKFILTTLFVLAIIPIYSQNLTANEVIKNAEEKMRGSSSEVSMKITIIRPKYTREMQMKSWSLGNDYSISLVTAPAKDAGCVFLKRQNEVYNWVPSIERTIKLPPSMMMQSWMGTDLTNDDLVRESSMVEDYDAAIIGEEQIEGRHCYQIKLIPKPDAPVVWSKVIIWIDKTDFLQLKIEFYDEDDYLVNTFLGKNIKNLGGRVLTSVFEVIPADKPGNKTIMEYTSIKFDVPLTEQFFTTQNMKNLK